MNKERRKKIQNIIQKIENIAIELNDVLQEEEFAFDNMPENLQGSLRGEESEEAMDYMNQASECLSETTEILANCL